MTRRSGRPRPPAAGPAGCGTPAGRFWVYRPRRAAGHDGRRADDRSWLPPPPLERLVRVAAGRPLLLPELDELRLLPPPPAFDRPLVDHVLVLAGRQHLPGHLGPEDDVATHAARLAVVVHRAVAAGHPLQEVLVADPPLAGQGAGQFQRVLGGAAVIV